MQGWACEGRPARPLAIVCVYPREWPSAGWTRTPPRPRPRSPQPLALTRAELQISDWAEFLLPVDGIDIRQLALPAGKPREGSQCGLVGDKGTAAEVPETTATDVCANGSLQAEAAEVIGGGQKAHRELLRQRAEGPNLARLEPILAPFRAISQSAPNTKVASEPVLGPSQTLW